MALMGGGWPSGRAQRTPRRNVFFFVKEEWRRGAEVERRAPTTMHIGGGQPGEGQRERTAEARLCGTHGRRVAMSVAWLSAHHGDFFNFFKS